MDIDQQKKEIRGDMRKKLDMLSNDTVVSCSDRFFHMFLEQYGDSDRFFVFVSKGNELSTHALIKKLLELGKFVCVPWWDEDWMCASRLVQWSDLDATKYGVLVQSDPSFFVGSIDVVVVPGLAFDDDGARLGQGMGYYDRWLSEIGSYRSAMQVVGVCYDFQLIEAVPCDGGDASVDRVLIF